MLSIYVPFVSTGNNSNPRSSTGDGLYEWVINSGTNTLTRIRKDTYALTDTVSLPNTNFTTITSGTYLGNNYIFTSSGSSTGNIYRINSDNNNPANTLVSISVTKTDISKNICSSVIAHSGGYLWIVPNTASNISGTIVRLNIFNNINKTSYDYTSSTSDAQVTVYTGISTISTSTSPSILYIYGNFVFTLYNGSPTTVITKLSTVLPETSGIVAAYSCAFTYTGFYINSITSDNISYIWMSETSSFNSRVYRMPIDYNLSITESTPTTNVTSFYSTLRSISTIKYGAGYLWVAGRNVSDGLPSLIQVDVTSNTILTTIPLINTTTSGITNPAISSISNIDIYSEYMWLTDANNSALLKMKIYTPCFREGTKILCLNSKMKEEYISIENIRKGQLVKTLLNGFVPVCMIGKTTISNPGTSDRIKNRLYKCSKENYPDLFEDLYITGCHSILVDELTDAQRESTMDALNDIYITDHKYRLMACIDERSEPYTEMGTYTIWHFALENSNYYMNYGVYANGLLVESTSKRYMKELSGMELLE